MKKLFAVLNVSTEDEAVISIGRMATELQAINALTGKQGSETVAVVTAWQQAAGQAAQAQAELAAIKQATADASAKTKIDQAVEDGRVTPAARSNFENLYAKFGAEALDAALEAVGTAPRSPSTGPGPRPADPVATLNDEEIAVAKQMGWSNEQMLEAKKAEASRAA